jgi:2-methylcitrate dehydratase
MSRADIERKFRGNVGDRWPKDRADAVLQTLWTLEAIDDISALLGKLGA